MICYIFVISLCAFDFWTVKNVTGRILVGLRWWSIIKEDGKEEWHFEALENSKYHFKKYFTPFFIKFIIKFYPNFNKIIISMFVCDIIVNKNAVDNRVFWTSQYLFGGVWVIFSIVSLLSFNISNLTVCTVASVLSITNTMGYIKCDKKHQKSVGGWMFTKAKDNLSSGQITKIAMMGMNNSSKLSSSISSISKA
jgi:hypothetical protein